jgi:hypothetical protein
VRTPRRVAGLAAVTVLALGAAACGIAEAGTGRAAPTAAQNLIAAAPDTSTPAFAYTSKGGCMAQFSGTVDPAAEIAQSNITVKTPAGEMTMSFLAFGTKASYVRLTSKPASMLTRLDVPRGWVKLNPDKIGSADDGLVTFNQHSIDPLGVGRLASTASGVVQDGSKFTGTLDLTRYGVDPSVVGSLAGLGDQAKTIPFEAVVDKAGNFSSMTIRMPSAKACTITQHKYGKAKKPSAPKAKKAPASVYEILND